METRDVAIDILKDRIEVLENALKEIDTIPASEYFGISSNGTIIADGKSVFWKIREITTKALWPL